MLKKIFGLFCFIFLILCNTYAEQITIAAEDAWIPFSSINKETGEVEGIGVDIVREAFKSVKINIKFKAMPYDRAMAKVKDGEEIACFNTPKDSSVEKYYLWPNDFSFKATGYYYALNDYSGEIKEVKDLEGKILGLTEGYGYADLDAIRNNEKISVDWSKSDDIILKKLIAKRVDVIILVDKVADLLTGQLGYKNKIKKVGVNSDMDMYIVFSKKHKDAKKYLELFNKGLAIIKKNGVYENIFKSWDAKFFK